MNNEITFRKLRKTDFSKLYRKLLISDEISNSKDFYNLLKTSIIFINSKNTNIEKLGYRIILLFSIKTNNYYPLYDVAINNGLYPIINLLEKYNLIDKTIYSEINSSFIEQFKNNNHYLSFEQYQLYINFEDKINDSLCVIAPTSYGKSELVVRELTKLHNKKICILVPTKTLLEETKNNILKNANLINIRLITHPDMYSKNIDSCVAVFTQERLLRLLKNEKDLFFDYVIIDEAHNLLAKDDRSLILSTSIMVLKKRNPLTVFKYLTPFVANYNSLNLKYIENINNELKISEYLKSEIIYYYNINNDRNYLELYDQFTNDFYSVSTDIEMNCFDFVKNYSGNKNIIYFNKPTVIESFAYKLASQLNEVDSSIINTAIDNIKEYVNNHYRLAYCLKHGVIYHHGAVPDIVRYYIEDLYKNCNEIKYVICSSTLLEGVNLSADKLFVMQFKRGLRNLSSSDIKNLIGRICRFGDIFGGSTNNIKLLSPQVYFIDSPEFSDRRSSMKNCIMDTLKIDANIKDKIDNPLLENSKSKKEDLDNNISFINNFEPNVIDGVNNNPKELHTDFGIHCIQNGITEIDVYKTESIMQTKISNCIENRVKISNCRELFEKINDIFLIEEIKSDDNNFKRLKNEKARIFYSFVLENMINNCSFSRLITKIMDFWKKQIDDFYSGKCEEAYAFVGRWGDTTRKGFKKYWIDLTTKKEIDLINLAIIKAKEEQDYINYTVMKFVEIFNDFDLIDKDFYNRIKYGTNDMDYIVMIHNGYSISLANLLLTEYKNYVSIDITNNVVNIDSSIINMMKSNRINDLLIFELKRSLK